MFKYTAGSVCNKRLYGTCRKIFLHMLGYCAQVCIKVCIQKNGELKWLCGSVHSQTIGSCDSLNLGQYPAHLSVLVSQAE